MKFIITFFKDKLMNNDSLLSVFLIIGIITVTVIDIIIIYMFISSFCFKKIHNDQIDYLKKPLIVSSINDNENIDGYYTSL